MDPGVKSSCLVASLALEQTRRGQYKDNRRTNTFFSVCFTGKEEEMNYTFGFVHVNPCSIDIDTSLGIEEHRVFLVPKVLYVL